VLILKDTLMQTNILSPDFLYRIEEAQDLVADACVCDESNHLIFLSIWGRDTATQEFLARLTLGTGEHGLDRFHLVTADATSIPVAVANAQSLEKRSTRAFQGTLFGSMLHVWLLDPRCVTPDKSNGSALAILPKGDVHSTKRLWSLVRDTCPLPLLPHWRDTTLDLLREREMLTRLAFSLGGVEGYRVALNIPALSAAIGALIRSGSLLTEESPLPAQSRLAKVA
jgi:hypothetical protein